MTEENVPPASPPGPFPPSMSPPPPPPPAAPPPFPSAPPTAPDAWPMGTLPPPKKSRKGLWIALIVVGAVAACCIGGTLVAIVAGNNIDVSQRSSKGDAPVAPVGIGSPVRDGVFEFVVNQVECGRTELGDQLRTSRPQGQFCVVNLSVRTIGGSGQRFPFESQKALNHTGDKYVPAVEATFLANGMRDIYGEPVNPGNTLTGNLAFDIPTTEKIAVLELHDSPLSKGAKVQVS